MVDSCREMRRTKCARIYGELWCYSLSPRYYFAIYTVIVQLLRLYVQWRPRNYEKCKMFRLIHINMMSLDKFRFVAQVATLGNFFY